MECASRQLSLCRPAADADAAFPAVSDQTRVSRGGDGLGLIYLSDRCWLRKHICL